jgi:ABC-type Fe3+-hydroxamate transport system substrate-binding protein
MKKVLFALFVIAAFTACHSTTEADLQKADSTKVDSVKKVVDSVKIVDTIKK